MQPTVEDLADLLGAVGADLQDVARNLSFAPEAQDPRELARMELAAVTTAEDDFSLKIADILMVIGGAL